MYRVGIDRCTHLTGRRKTELSRMPLPSDLGRDRRSCCLLHRCMFGGWERQCVLKGGGQVFVFRDSRKNWFQRQPNTHWDVKSAYCWGVGLCTWLGCFHLRQLTFNEGVQRTRPTRGDTGISAKVYDYSFFNNTPVIHCSQLRRPCGYRQRHLLPDIEYCSKHMWQNR